MTVCALPFAANANDDNNQCQMNLSKVRDAKGTRRAATTAGSSRLPTPTGSAAGQDEWRKAMAYHHHLQAARAATTVTVAMIAETTATGETADAAIAAMTVEAAGAEMAAMIASRRPRTTATASRTTGNSRTKTPHT